MYTTTDASHDAAATQRTPQDDQLRVWLGDGKVPVDHYDFDSLMTLIEAKVEVSSGPCLTISSVNLDHLHHYGSGDFFGATATAGDWRFVADGWPIASRAARATQLEWPRLAGSDLLPHILTLLANRSRSLALVGGSPEMQAKFGGIVSERFPDLNLVGSWAPEREEILSEQFNNLMAWELRRRRPDVVLVALPKPLSEQWILRHADATAGTVFLPFGAAADFLAGRVKRAPKLLQTMRLEWLYRLLQEPRRMARRYLVQGPLSLRLLVKRCVTAPPVSTGPPSLQLRDHGKDLAPDLSA